MTALTIIASAAFGSAFTILATLAYAVRGERRAERERLNDELF